MSNRLAKRAVLFLTLLGTVALGGCIIAPYPHYAYGYGYGPGYYRPHYWWR